MCWTASDLAGLGRDREGLIDNAMIYKAPNDEDDPKVRWYDEDSSPRVEYRYKMLYYDVKENNKVVGTMSAKVLELQTDKATTELLKAAMMDIADNADVRKYSNYVPTKTLTNQDMMIELMNHTSIYIMGVHQDILHAKILKASHGT